MSETVTVAKRLEKFSAFSGFRGIGVLIVVFSHCPEVFESSFYNLLWEANQASRIGYVALDIFFVMSGFFITRLSMDSSPLLPELFGRRRRIVRISAAPIGVACSRLGQT